MIEPSAAAEPQANDVQPTPSFFRALCNGLLIRTIQSVIAPLQWAGDRYRSVFPVRNGPQPSLVKSYDCRPSLPINIFFPTDWDETSPATLPCFFSIHGGGFCIGSPNDSVPWDRAFADANKFIVIALNYRKAPAYPYPTAIHDVEALLLAAYNDASLPIDKKRIAIGGFSAGGNLTLAVAQLPAIREQVKPSALVPMYPSVDQSVPLGVKDRRRYYKPGLGPGLRSAATDYLTGPSRYFKWSYIPYGHPLRDPYMSPIFAPREHLPRKIFIIAAELDQLAHEAWRMACQLAHRPVPSTDDKPGQEKPAATPGVLISDDERFAFEHIGDDGTEVRWLLVPDQIHGFDLIPARMHSSKEAYRDAQLKTKAYQQAVAHWLRQSAWKDLDATSA